MKKFKIDADKTKLCSIAGAVLAGIIALNSYTIVTAEAQGAVTSFGEVHSNKVLEGFNWVMPWWSIDEYNTLLVTETIDDMGIPSQDKFKTMMDISYTGHFLKGAADKIRATTGTESQYLDTHVKKKVRSCTIGAGTRVESSQAFFNEVIQVQMSTYVTDCVNNYLNTEQVGGGYEITQVQFTDISLDPIVKKFMVTTKKRQEQEDQQESTLRIADLESQEAIVVSISKATASSNNKKAAQNVSDANFYDVQKIAEGNALLRKSISPELIQYVLANAWDGKRSKIVAGQGTELLIDSRGE